MCIFSFQEAARCTTFAVWLPKKMTRISVRFARALTRLRPSCSFCVPSEPSIAVATNLAYKGAEGEAVIETIWHNVAAWSEGKNAGLADLQKGQAVEVQGRIRNQRYIATDGTERFTTEILARGAIVHEGISRWNLPCRFQDRPIRGRPPASLSTCWLLLPEDQIDVFRSGATQAYYALMEMYITTPETFGLIAEELLANKNG